MALGTVLHPTPPLPLGTSVPTSTSPGTNRQLNKSHTCERQFRRFNSPIPTMLCWQVLTSLKSLKQRLLVPAYAQPLCSTMITHTIKKQQQRISSLFIRLWWNNTAMKLHSQKLYMRASKWQYHNKRSHPYSYTCGGTTLP